MKGTGSENWQVRLRSTKPHMSYQRWKLAGTYQWHLPLKDVVPQLRRCYPSFLPTDMTVYMQACPSFITIMPFCQNLIPANSKPCPL